MTFANRFKIIHRVIKGEITSEEALRLMKVAEVMPLPLGKP